MEPRKLKRCKVNLEIRVFWNHTQQTSGRIYKKRNKKIFYWTMTSLNDVRGKIPRFDSFANILLG